MQCQSSFAIDSLYFSHEFTGIAFTTLKYVVIWGKYNYTIYRKYAE